jgi:hypothetical protein
MPFSYYERLSALDKAVYLQSDAVAAIRLPQPEALRLHVVALEAALTRDERAAVESAARLLSRGLCERLGVPEVVVEVLAVRPTLRSAELHGLYTRASARPARIQVWMRTAHHRRVVAFRTFLRTLLHEWGHHLDYTYLRLQDSFHTEGFFRRESSLFRQLIPPEPPAVR